MTNDLNKLNDVLNNEKNNVSKLEKEIKDLKDNHKSIKNIYDQEKLTNVNLNKQINQLTSELNALKLNLDEKNKEISSLKNGINTSSNNIHMPSHPVYEPGEYPIIAHFKSVDQTVDRPILSKNTELFVDVEKKLYKDYPDFKELNTYFTVNGTMIKRFKTMEDNKIKDNDKICLMVYDMQ